MDIESEIYLDFTESFDYGNELMLYHRLVEFDLKYDMGKSYTLDDLNKMLKTIGEWKVHFKRYEKAVGSIK